MLLAELAVFLNLQTIRIILLVLVGLVISLLAFGAGQSNQSTHL